MARRTSHLARFKSLLEVDPESLEGVLPRTRAPAGDDQAAVSLSPGDWERLIHILKRGLDQIGARDLQLLAIEHVAEIYEEQLGDPERSLRWWAQVLSAYPFPDRAAEELERLARKSGDWRRLVQVYATALSRVSAPVRRQIQQRTARVHLEELGEPDRAERILREIWEKEQDGPALDALQAFYERVGRQDELVRLLRHRIGLENDFEQRIELLLQLAYLQDVELGAPELALEAYREVLRLDPMNRPAAEALEQIYLRQERWLELLSVYEAMAAAASSGEQAAHYLVRMARICDDAVGERVRSRQLWQRLRELRPDDEKLLEEMARRFEPMERWEELCEVLERQAALAEPARRARLLEKQGRIYGDRLKEPGRALACWRQVLELEPDSVVALLAMSELCGQSESWEELRAVLQRLIAIGQREGRGPDFLMPLHASLADLEERTLGNPDRAVESWREVLALEPDQPEALEALERLLAGELRWAECVEVLDRRRQAAGDPQQVIEILLRQAVIFRDGLADMEAASRAYHGVLEVDAGEARAHRGLCEILREQGRWQDLTEQVFAWLETVSEQRIAVQLLQEVAVIFEERLGEPEQAFLVWQSALSRDPSNEVTISNLERLASSLRRWEDLLEVLRAAVQATPTARIRLNLLVTMGRCHGLELGQLEQAVTLLHEALHIDPEAIPALEVLAECYRRAGRWPELLMIVRRHAELERNSERLVPLLCELGALQYQLGAADQALVSYRKVVELEPGRREALQALETLYGGFEMWSDLLEVLRKQLELGVDPGRQLSITVQIGELHEQRLGNPVSAIAAYREALSVAPDNLEVMHALERLYEQTGDGEAYLDILERQLDLQERATEEKVSMGERIAAAWEEQFGRPDRAMACLEKMVALDPAHQPAYAALERLCRQTGDLRRLAQVLRRHARESTGTRRVELLLELGGLLAESLRELEPAAEVYQEVLALEEEEPRALLALAGVQEKLGHWRLAVETLDRLARALSEPVQRAAVLIRLARIEEAELHEPHKAESRYEQALALDGNCFEAMQRLAEIYRDRQDWRGAAAMMVRAEPHTSNLARKAQLLFEAGMIRLERLDEEASAAELFARTLEVDPDHLRAGLPLSRIYEKQGRLAELEPVLDMLARKVEPKDRALCQEVCFRLGRTAAALGKVDKAIRFFLEARGHDPKHLPTLQGLAELQLQTEQWQEAFKTLQTILVHHRDSLQSEQVAEVFSRLGAIKERQREARKALSYYEKALEVLPTARQALEASARIQASLGNWEEVVRAKTRLLAVVDAAERPELLQECAELHLNRLENLAAAIDAFHAAVALRPDDRGLLTRLVELLGEAGRWPEVLQVVLRLAELEVAPEVKARFLYMAAAVCRDELGRPEQAIDLFEAALDASVDHLKAFEAIDRLYTERKDWHSLAHSYRRMIARLGEQGAVPLRGTLWHNLGEVYRTRLRQIPEAIAAFEVASRLEPADLQRHAILAELYGLAGPAMAEKAVAEHRLLMALDSGQWETSLAALADLYRGLGQVDAQYCISSALLLLGRGTAEAERLCEKHRRGAPLRPRSRMTEELWQRCVRHPAQDPRVDALLSAVAPALTAALARPVKEFGLKRKHRARGDDQLTSLFHTVTGVLGATVAELYTMPEQAIPLMLANTSGGPSVVVGAPLLGALSEAELAFTLGQQLTYLRSGLFLCRLFPSPVQLRLVLLAAARLCAAGLEVEPAEAAEVARLQEQLAAVLPACSWPELVSGAQPLLDPTDRLDIAAWWNALTDTANRVGLIFAGDLHVAARILQLEPSPFGSIPASDRIRELLTYSISPEYLQVRRELGLSIG